MERNGKEEKEGSDMYTKTHSDRPCQYRNGVAHWAGWYDEGGEEECEETREAQAG